MIPNNKPFFNLSPSMAGDSTWSSVLGLCSAQSKESKTPPPGHYKQDTDLLQKLKMMYLEYVLFSCAVGAKKFFEDGHMKVLNVPDDQSLIVENISYINECDSFNRFIGENCVGSPGVKR